MIQFISKPFAPTHIVTVNGGRIGGFDLTDNEVEVMLDDGAAYSRVEWELGVSADFECDDSGRWTFQGQPFAVSVRKINTMGV